MEHTKLVLGKLIKRPTNGTEIWTMMERPRGQEVEYICVSAQYGNAAWGS